MQPQASAAQRAYSQRRSPGATDPGPPPNVSVRAISPGMQQGHPQQRQSNASVRSAPSTSGSRRTTREVRQSQPALNRFRRLVGDSNTAGAARADLCA